MAVCLATTPVDQVEDEVEEVVRIDDETCFINQAIITSYNPLAYHLNQLSAHSEFRGWLDSRGSSPAADLYIARCSRGRSCDRCDLAKQITCISSDLPLCIACSQRFDLYCSIFFRNSLPCRRWTDDQAREFAA